MSDLSDMISEARRNNHTDDQIIQFLLEKDADLAPMIRSAMDQKHSAKNIADFLMTYEPAPPPEPINPRIRQQDISNVGPAASEASRDALARAWAKTDAARGVKPDLGFTGNVSEAAKALWDVPGQMLDFARHPFRSLAQGVDESVARSKAAFKRGDPSTGIGYALAAPFTPLGGGVAAQGAEELGGGNYGAGLVHSLLPFLPYRKTIGETRAALTPDVVTRTQLRSPVTFGPPRIPLLSDFIKRYGPDAGNVHPKLTEAMGYAGLRQLTRKPQLQSPITINPKQPPAAPPAAAGRTPVRPPVRPPQPPNPRTQTIATGSTLAPPTPTPAAAPPPPATPPAGPPAPPAPPAAAPPGAAPPAAAGPVPNGLLAPFAYGPTAVRSARPGPAAPSARTFEPPFPARQPGLPEPPAAAPGITPDMVEIVNQMLEADQAPPASMTPPPGETAPPQGTPPPSGADAPSATGAASGAASITEPIPPAGETTTPLGELPPPAGETPPAGANAANPIPGTGRGGRMSVKDVMDRAEGDAAHAQSLVFGWLHDAAARAFELTGKQPRGKLHRAMSDYIKDRYKVGSSRDISIKQGLDAYYDLLEMEGRRKAAQQSNPMLNPPEGLVPSPPKKSQ